MAECYLCGSYIEPGRGYRRKVQTGTSTRIYMTKRGGASYGMHHGLRTLCQRCATIQDRLEQGQGWRYLGYFLGWVTSAVLGWNIVVHGNSLFTTLTGFACILGLPIIIIGGIIERSRDAAIVDEVYGRHASRDAHYPGVSASAPNDAKRPNETPEEWLDRVLPANLEPDVRATCFKYAVSFPPLVGQRLANWAESWPIGSESTRPDPDIEEANFVEGETVEIWLQRSAKAIADTFGQNQAEVEAWLSDLAQHAHPKHGERIRDFIDRAQAVRELDERS